MKSSSVVRMGLLVVAVAGCGRGGRWAEDESTRLALSDATPIPYRDDFDAASLGPGWRTEDGRLLSFPWDEGTFATFAPTGTHMSVAVPGGSDHNMWHLLQASVLRPYAGSGVYEIKMDSGLAGSQQFGLLFRNTRNTFMLFMFYTYGGSIWGYVERFAHENGTQYKKTFPGEGTSGHNSGLSTPHAGPYYMRVTVVDNDDPGRRAWKFQWSLDGNTWNTVVDGVLESPSEPGGAVGPLQEMGFFAGNQWPDMTAFDGRFDYFSVAPLPAPPPPPPPPPSHSALPAAGLELLLDASDLQGSVADGQAVTTWPDAAGTGYSATGAGATAPRFVASSIAGRPAVRFDGADDFLSLSGGFGDFTGGLSLFIVTRPSQLNSGGPKILLLGNGANRENIGLGRTSSGAGLQYFVDRSDRAVGWFNTSDALVSGEPALFDLQQAGGPADAAVTAALRKNGGQVGGGSVYVPPVATRTLNYIGKNYWNTSVYSGDVAEIILYRRALTPSEVQTVYQYVGSKYQLTIGGDAPPPPPPPPTGPLPAPTGVAASSDVGQVTVSWDAVSGATGYRVFRGTASGGPYTLLATASGLGHDDLGGTAGTTYFYVVRAYDPTRESVNSAEVSGTPQEPPPPPPPLPTTEGLELWLDASQLTSVAGGQAVTTWQDAAGSGYAATASGSGAPVFVRSAIGGRPAVRFDGIDDFLALSSGFRDFTGGITLFFVTRPTQLTANGFKMFTLGNGANVENIGLGRAGTTAGLQYFVDRSDRATGWFDTASGLVAGEAAVFEVQQPGGAADAAVSATVSKNGTALGSGNVYVPPVAPRTVNYIGKNLWNAGLFGGDIAEVILYRRALSNSEVNAVRSYVASKYGLSITPPPPPPPPPAPEGVTATSGLRQVSLAWNAVPGADGYRVFRAPAAGGPYALLASTGATSHTDTTGTVGTPYFYLVRAHDVNGESADSAVVSAAPAPLPPPAGVVAASGVLQVGLSWDAASGGTGYRVFRGANAAGPYALLADVAGTSYTDAAVTAGTTYWYVVRTYDGVGESVDSSAVSGTPVAPSTLPTTAGLELWLDASRLKLANGQAVALWQDASGRGYQATGNGGTAPVFVTSSMGGKPAVRFDGKNDFLTLSGGFRDFTAGVSLFIVTRAATSSASGSKIFLLGNGASRENVGLGRNGTTAGLQYFVDDASRRTSWFNTASGWTAGSASLLEVQQPSGTANTKVTAVVSRNGAALGSGQVYVPPVATRSTNYIGKSYWSNVVYAGDVAEIVVYRRTLTASELTAVRSYLMNKYGVAP